MRRKSHFVENFQTENKWMCMASLPQFISCWCMVSNEINARNLFILFFADILGGSWVEIRATYNSFTSAQHSATVKVILIQYRWLNGRARGAAQSQNDTESLSSWILIKLNLEQFMHVGCWVICCSFQNWNDIGIIGEMCHQWRKCSSWRISDFQVRIISYFFCHFPLLISLICVSGNNRHRILYC